MAGPTWRQVQGPRFDDAIAAYRMGADLIDRGLSGARAGVKAWDDNQIRETSNSLTADLMRFQNDPKALNAAIADGSLMKGYDPRRLSAEAIAAIGGRQQDLQNFELGTRNIEGVGLRNAGLGTANERAATELGDLKYQSGNARADNDWLRGTGRDIAREYDAVLARTRDPKQAYAWLTSPEVQARLKGGPADFVQSLTTRGTAVPMDYAKFVDQGEITNNRVDDRRTSAANRAVMGAQVGQIGAQTEATRQATTITGAGFNSQQVASGAMTGILEEGAGSTDTVEGALSRAIKKNPALAKDPQAQEILRRTLIETYKYGVGRPIVDGAGNEVINKVDPAAEKGVSPPFVVPPLLARPRAEAPANPASDILAGGSGNDDLAGGAAADLFRAAAPRDRQAQFGRILQIEGGTDRRGNFLTSPKGAIGPAQVMPGTAPEAARLAGLPFDEKRYRSDPAYNKALGEAYYTKQLRDFGGDPIKAAAAYNAGPGSAKSGRGVRGAMARAAKAGQADNWVAFLPAETRNYVAKFAGEGAQSAGTRYASGDIGANYMTQQAVAPSMAPAISPTLAALNSPQPIAPQAAAEIERAAGGVDPRDELLRQLIAERQQPRPIMGEDPQRRRRSTNVAAILGQAGALSRYS